MTFQEIFKSHPQPTGLDREVLLRCVAECLDCAAKLYGLCRRRPRRGRRERDGALRPPLPRLRGYLRGDGPHRDPTDRAGSAPHPRNGRSLFRRLRRVRRGVRPARRPPRALPAVRRNLSPLQDRVRRSSCDDRLARACWITCAHKRDDVTASIASKTRRRLCSVDHVATSDSRVGRLRVRPPVCDARTVTNAATQGGEDDRRDLRAEHHRARGGAGRARERRERHAGGFRSRALAAALELGQRVKLFEEAGYAGLTPSWPDDPETVEEARSNPDVLAKKTLKQVADHTTEIIDALDKKPAVIGHSTGGLARADARGPRPLGGHGGDRPRRLPRRSASAVSVLKGVGPVPGQPALRAAVRSR